MSQDRKGDTSTLSIIFFAGAIGIVIWSLAEVSDFIEGVSEFLDSGVSPIYALFLLFDYFGVFLLVVVLAGIFKDVVNWSLTGPTKNETELSEEEPSSKADGEKEGKKQLSMKQILVLYVISAILLLTILDFLLPGSYFLNN